MAYVVYSYTPDRSATGPDELFKDFKGYLQADAYSAYDGLYKPVEIVEVGCMMHARRKFSRRGPATRCGRTKALAWVSLLYDVEREAKERGPTDYDAFVGLRHEMRAERSLPILTVPRLAGGRAAEGSAQEPDRRSDSVRLEPLGGAHASSGSWVS